jgi:hypothetical protein
LFAGVIGIALVEDGPEEFRGRLYTTAQAVLSKRSGREPTRPDRRDLPPAMAARRRNPGRASPAPRGKRRQRVGPVF